MIERDLSHRYRLEGRIGQGGMAVVHAGTDTVLRRRVAIKVLRPHLAADAEFVARFYGEAQHAAGLAHPNIVAVYDVGREGDDYVIVMELVEGSTLGEMIAHDGKLPEPVAIEFAAQLCDGLAFAHRQGILHRDVKPANVLVTADDVVKLSDFGIARAVSSQTLVATQAGMVFGSASYLSPEQAQGHELTAASDLYSLGVVLYEMLAGVLPYVGDSAITVALKHVSAPVPATDPDDLGISAALAAVVRRLMAKDPAARFASAGEAARALRAARDHPAFDRGPAPAPEPAPRRAAPVTIPNPKPRPSPRPDRPEPAAAAAAVTERPRSRTVRTVRALVLAVALVAAGFAGYRLTRGPAPGTQAPPRVVLGAFAGRDAAAAERGLDAAGLRHERVEVPSASVPARRVVRQQPPPRTVLAPGELVRLFVSSGAATIALMDLRHYSADDARRYLDAAHLAARVTPVHDAAAAGTVLAQAPPAGAAVAAHAVVALTVSSGPRPVAVPDLVSASVADAGRRLAALGLSVTVASRDASSDIPEGEVIAQTPAAGTAVAAGSAVAVTVSGGPPRSAVPGVVGVAADDAARTLAAAGALVRVDYVVDAAADAGDVVSQRPAAGAAVARGATVTLDVAVPGTIPDVSDESAADAAAVLARAGYRAAAPAGAGPGRAVVRTDPPAGTALRPGGSVSIVLRDGPAASP